MPGPEAARCAPSFVWRRRINACPPAFQYFFPNQARLLLLILQGIKLKQFFQAGKCAFCRPANHFHLVIVLLCFYNVHYEPFGSQYFLFEKISTYSFSGFCKYNIINTLTCINCEYPVWITTALSTVVNIDAPAYPNNSASLLTTAVLQTLVHICCSCEKTNSRFPNSYSRSCA